MSDVTLTKGVRQNLLSLQKTADIMAVTQNRLATGKRVNTALDNPTNFFTASSLQSRAGDLNALMDSMANGIKTLEAADNGLTAITRAVESMQSTLRQARQDKSFKTESYALDPTAIGSAALKNLSFSGGSVVGTEDVAVNQLAVQSTLAASADYVAPVAATGPVYLAPSNFTSLDTTDTDETYTFTVSRNGVPVTVTLDGSDDGGDTAISQAEAIVGINADLTAAGSTIRARVGTGAGNAGKLEFYDSDATNVGTGATIDIGPVTTGGTSPSAAANLGWTGDPATVTGVAAVDRVFTISNGRATATITLTSANAATAAAADDEINAQLAAAGITNITAATTANRVDLTGDAGGVANISVGGVSANQVFGVAPPIVAGIEGRPKTIDEIVSAINSNTDLKGRVRASNDNGKLRIENQATGDLSIVGVSGATAKIDGSTGITNTATVGGNDVRKSLVQQFNTLRDQLDKFADDGSFSGVNLLRGDKLTLTFNETGSSTIEIQAKDEASQPISINASTLGIFTLATTAFDSDDTIDGLLVSMSKSLTVIRSQASNFGSNLAIVENRTDFTKAMINTLETGADGLTLADTNEEAANMLALQTRQQLSSTALSLSSQADQAVLRLFG